jgi:exodeoxyribonuclease V alpha subunit
MFIYHKKSHEIECSLAEMVAKQMKHGCDEVEPIQGDLDDRQFNAVRNACTKNLSILRGLPGTGKTTSLQQVIESFSGSGMRGVIACPTGKAAKRAYEVVSGLAERGISFPECVTAHRCLGFSGSLEGESKFFYNKDNKFDLDYIVLDEFSMAGSGISHALFEAIDPEKTRVVLCGDNNQLPSVDPGAVFRDMILSKCISDTYLTHIYRQGKNSGISHNSARVLRGSELRFTDSEDRKYNDIFFVGKINEGASFGYLCDIIADKLPQRRGFDRVRDIQMLCPGRKGDVGTIAMNGALRDRLNPGGQFGYYKFRLGDKVINRKNNYELGIVNGDVGVVKEIGQSGMEVDFGLGAGSDGKGIVKILGDVGANIRLAYAFTVHSSQGSEFPCVVMVLHKSHYRLLDRNMLYTGMTRGKKLVVIVGDQSCVRRCIENNSADRRFTGLSKRIARLCNK